MLPMLPDDDPTEEVGVRDLMAALRDAIRSSPFGEGDDTEVAPFSASQLLLYMRKLCHETVADSHIDSLLPMVEESLEMLEERTREVIGRRLDALVAAQEKAGSTSTSTFTSTSSSSSSPALPRKLVARWGPAALRDLLNTDVPRFSCSTLGDVQACFSALACLAARCTLWAKLIDADGAASLPPEDVEAWRRERTAPPEKWTWPPTLEHELSVEKRTAMRTLMSMQPPKRCWDVHLRLEYALVKKKRQKRDVAARMAAGGGAPSEAEPLRISRVTLFEDVSGALTPASKPPRLPNGSSFASRDLFFAPPIELSKPGCFVEMHLEVPRVTDYDDAEPPKFFVSRVFLAPEPTPEPALDDVADDDEELEVYQVSSA